MATTTTARRPPGSPGAFSRAYAVTWITPRRALIARRAPSGEIRLQQLERRLPVEDEEQFLVRVSLDVGPANRVMVLGPVLDRVRFERVDVAIHGRPERLVDGPPDVYEAPTVDQLELLLEPAAR
jgi:hypothetical protein